MIKPGYWNDVARESTSRDDFNLGEGENSERNEWCGMPNQVRYKNFQPVGLS